MTGRDFSLGDRWTSVAAVVAAARARGAYLMAWDPDNLGEHREVLVTTAPDRVWAIHRSREPDGGWCAVRLASDGADLPDTLVRLAAADARGSQVVDALLDAEARSTRDELGHLVHVAGSPRPLP